MTTLAGPPLPPPPGPARRIAPFAALGVLALLVGLATAPDRGHTSDLSGPWGADDGEGVPFHVPGLLAVQGRPSGGRVHLHRRVVLPLAEQSLFLESPQFAVSVTLDGRVVAAQGDPSSDLASDRSVRSLVVDLPPVEPGSTHTIGLDLRGDFGMGGIVGQVLLGPPAAVRSAQSLAELQRLLAAVAVCLLGAVPLFVATRNGRRAPLAYGAFVVAAGALLVSGSDTILRWLPDPVGALRFSCAAGFASSALGAWCMDEFGTRPSPTAVRVFAAVGGAGGVAALLAPPAAMGAISASMDAAAAAFGVALTVVTYQSWRIRAPGAYGLVAALVFVLYGVGSEVALVQGLRGGPSHLGPAALGLALSLGTTLALRDADLSDRHERLVRSSLDALVTVDAGGRIEEANPAARRLLGEVTAAPATLWSLVAEAHRPLVRAHLGRATNRPDRCEFQTPQERRVESLATPLGNGLVMLTLRDVTLRREMDRAVLQSARLETAGVLMGGIAHDFNNMLGSVLAHVGLLRLQVPDPAVRARLDKMEATVERASELTRRLITVARGTGSELAAVDLAEVCRGARDLAEPTLPSGVRLEVDLPAELPAVLGAGGDLEQVLVNLLVNARDAVGERGQLRLAARALPGRAGVVVLVEDDGPGIPKAVRDRIFEPFYTGKPHGTGLGLAVARQILRDHHGRIWVEDRPGGGARFFLALRHADAVDEAPAALPEHRRVLVVEDDPLLLEAEVEALRAGGYEVTGTTQASEAQRWLRENPVDLLVTDVRMPGVDGVALARAFRAAHPAAPILFVTAYVPKDDLESLEPGTWAALVKPVRPARLLATVGHLRRRAERVAVGSEDVTEVSWAFPALDALTGASLGF